MAQVKTFKTKTHDLIGNGQTPIRMKALHLTEMNGYVAANAING